MIGEGISQIKPPHPLPDEPVRIENRDERIWVYNNRTASQAWQDILPWLADTTTFMIKLDRLNKETWAVIIYTRKQPRPALPDSLLLEEFK